MGGGGGGGAGELLLITASFTNGCDLKHESYLYIFAA